MNTREGMRRIAIAFGFSGCIVGMLVGYGFWTHADAQRAAANRFEALARLPITGRVIKALRERHLSMADLERIASGSIETIAVDSDGIKSVSWDGTSVVSIQTPDGETIPRTPAVSLWRYVGALLCPIAGFFAPWLIIRGLAWVGSGFSAPSS